MSLASRNRDLTPQQLKSAIDAGRVLLVDVREPNEFAAERIDGAINLPLSQFDPRALPDAGDRTVVLQCAGGKRSGMARERCQMAGAMIDTHLAGGLAAWKAAGLPTVHR